MTTTTTYNEAAVCVPRAGTLYDVLELILDRGMVIDIFVRVSLVGIEILKIDARVVVASVDTYLRFAEVCNRLDLNEDSSTRALLDLLGGVSAAGVASSGAKKTAKSVGGRVKELIGMDDGDDGDRDEDDGDEEEKVSSRARGSRTGSGTKSSARTASRSGSAKASKSATRTGRHPRAAK